eukprot:CAMPEP_0196150560 /NCGR_PEP_ID=MMETSP0910-20130528/31954_1 /TAXON_ID=49265 /ORGANISM="Thalassiosira rotula, Strain GSO102" /LENGTH=107 /DNA_ID=CAMNT_0041413705 /DNA_START=104 /DNA_END=423 /DNA_ORIENTATION=+
MSAIASSKLFLTILRTNANVGCPSSILSYMSLEFCWKRISLPAMVVMAVDPDDEVGDSHDGIFGGCSDSSKFCFVTSTAGVAASCVLKNSGTGTAVGVGVAAAAAVS